MRVSLSSAHSIAPCSRGCTYDYPRVVFNVITDGHSGDTEVICLGCLLEGTRSDVTVEPLITGPAPRKKALKKAKKTSLRQERDIAEEFGGRTQPGSGNQAGAKGDVRKRGELRIEAKYTEADSYRLVLDDLYKIAGEAAHGELPVFVIDFLSPGIRRLRDRFAVIHADHLKELLNAASTHRRSKRSA